MAKLETAPASSEQSTLDCTSSPRHWTREQRVDVARQLHGSMRTRDIARRLEVTPATVRDYLADPTGERARARREQRPPGNCQRCGCATGPDRGDRRFALCPRCTSDERADWQREDVIDAYLDWWMRFGEEPSSTDWNHTHAARRGEVALARFSSQRWPTMTVVHRLLGPWSHLAIAARARRDQLSKAT
jgi:hypothetical protein